MTTILCVDDDHLLTDFLRVVLEHEGFTVLVARTGRDALRLLHTMSVDLVILDITLPDMAGLAVLASLSTFSRTPVIMLTGCARDEEVIACLEHGADDYVVKPFNVAVLVCRMQSVLRRARPPAAQYSAAHRSGEAIAGAEMNGRVGPEDAT